MSEASTDRPLLALVMRLAGIAGFGLMAAMIKLASDSGVHMAELVFWRQAVSVPILMVWAMAVGGLSTLKTQRPRAHAVRGLLGLVGMVLNFGGLILLPLAEATTMNFSSPIWAVVLSVVLLKEKVGLWRMSAVALGFAGILIIAQPGGQAIPLGGAAVAIGGAFMIALISIYIRDLNRTEKPVVIVFWFAVISSVLTLPTMLYVHDGLTSEQMWLLLGIGVTGTWGQVLITAALRYGQVSSVIVMDYSNLVWATLYGWLLFATLPGPGTWLGMPLIVIAGLIITWRERTATKKRFVDQRQATGT